MNVYIFETYITNFTRMPQQIKKNGGVLTPGTPAFWMYAWIEVDLRSVGPPEMRLFTWSQV